MPPKQVVGSCSKASHQVLHINCSEKASHQLLGNASSMLSLPVLPARPEGTPHANPLGQHVCGVLHKSPRRPLLEAPLSTVRMPSGIGSTPSALAESGAHTGQIEPRSGQVILEQCSLRGVNAQSADGSENLGDLWRGRGRTLRLMKQLSLPDLSFEGRGCVAPRMAQPPPLRIPPIALIPQVIRWIKERDTRTFL